MQMERDKMRIETANQRAFPAHAGMNRTTKKRGRNGVPRACGDEPKYAALYRLYGWRSPRMRG